MSSKREFAEVSLGDRLRATPDQKEQGFSTPPPDRVPFDESGTLGCGQRGLGGSQRKSICRCAYFGGVTVSIAC
jgi:hypothetical protein